MKPVLDLDTCAILDIVRDPRRRDVRLNDQRASILLLEAAERERVDVFVTSLVRGEFAENAEATEREAERSLAAITADVIKLDALATLHGSPGNADILHWRNQVRCRQVADRWLEVSKDDEASDAASRRAMARVLKRQPPSRRDKDSMEDCLILETYLEHARRARQLGLQKPAVFVSSNTNDYAKSAARLPSELKSDFADAQMDYAPNMATAHALVWA